MDSTKTNVLVVFANPKGTSQLRLGAEDRAIKEAIRRSKNRDNISLNVNHATTVHDLRRALLDADYKIIQISGHGTGKGLVLEDDLGQEYVVPQQALADLFEAYTRPKGTLECVILNACYSISQGKLTSLGIPCTIAMEGSISDNAAIEFSRGFYDALGANRPIEFAYDEGCRTVKLAAPISSWNSRILRRGEVYTEDSSSQNGEAVEHSNAGDACRSVYPVSLTAVKALAGFAIDLSGSMEQNIRNNTGRQFSRLESFRKSLDLLVKEAQLVLQKSRENHQEATIDIFAYGFGLRSPHIQTCDLLSLIKVGQGIIERGEIERLKQRYISEAQNQFKRYDGLGGFAQSLGFGGLVGSFENTLRTGIEQQVRTKILLELSHQIEIQLEAAGETTLPVEEVVKLWKNSEEILKNAEGVIYSATPMCNALMQVASRFKKDLASRPNINMPILFVLSDGEPTDGDPSDIVNSLKASGITVISCFVTNSDISEPRTLFTAPQPQWDRGANLMFNMASSSEENPSFAQLLLSIGWNVPDRSKLFVQINNSQILEEFINVVLGPLEAGALINSLPQAI
jgi:hypothetical protein